MALYPSASLFPSTSLIPQSGGISMAFPTTPRDTSVGLFVNGGWVDVTGDVYARDGISITRGGRDETSRVEPSTCRLTLNNRSGKYSPRNPNGAYYGSIGRNTPLRISVGKDTDTFARTVSSGWGSSSGSSSPWSTFSFGGTIAASDYNVGPGVGTHSVPANDADRNTYLGSQLYGDVDVTVSFSLTLASITGDVVAPANLLLRGTDPDNFILLWLFASDTDGRYHVNLYDRIAGTFFLTGPASNVDTGIVYAPSTFITARVQVEGPIVRAKIWPTSSAEPYDWLVAAGSNIEGPGWVGIQSYINPANTNTKPIVFSYDNFTVRIPRFAGEVSYWPQRWDTSGKDVFVPIEASGLKRRLGQGTAPLNSAMFTSMTTLPTPAISYWPCEDGAASTQLSSAIGGNTMFVTGDTKFADFDRFVCSKPLPTLNVSTWSARVPPYTSSGSMALTYLVHIPTSDPPDGPGAGWPITQIFTDGNAPQYEVKYRNGGQLQVNIWSPSGILHDSGALTLQSGTLIDTLWAFCLNLTQNGSNIDWMLSIEQPGSTVSSFWSGTLTSRTMGKATRVVVDPYQQMKDVTIGHINLRNEDITVVDRPISYGLNAFSGPPELGGTTAGNRIFSLANDAGVPLDIRGDADFTAPIGPQRPLPLLTLLEESADADMGVLHEVRNSLGLVYRTRRSMYNQPARLTLNYAGGQVAPPLEPVDDDQTTRNDVIAKRTDGGSFEIFLSSGRLSVEDPWNGGVGAYTDSPELNVNFDSQLPDVAGWRLLLGTVDEARYPTIAINLANPNFVSAGLENVALTVDVGDRIVITNPFTGSTPDEISQIVRGYTETLNVFEHTISFVCAPASPYEILRSDTPGKATVDSGASTLASSVTTTATSWSVATAAGNALWVTGAVNFDLPMEGERVTVTNISGTSSPQTFTVTRSVNGVVKAHASGLSVGLFRPALVGL